MVVTMDKIILAFENKDRIIKLVKQGAFYRIKDTKDIDDTNIFYIKDTVAVKVFNEKITEVN